MQTNNFQKAVESLDKAIALSPLETEKQLLRKKLELCKIV